jgi:hypothetical protein
MPQPSNLLKMTKIKRNEAESRRDPVLGPRITPDEGKTMESAETRKPPSDKKRQTTTVEINQNSQESTRKTKQEQETKGEPRRRTRMNQESNDVPRSIQRICTSMRQIRIGITGD